MLITSSRGNFPAGVLLGNPFREIEVPEYAKRTDVPVERSKAELERVMQRWGVDGFMTAWEGTTSVIAFKYRGLHARINLAMPTIADDDIKFTPTGILRTGPQQKSALEQASRQRWRALVLFVKATLEAVDSGIISFEQAFLPYLVLPDSRTVTDALMPGIYAALEQGNMPPMLPSGYDD